jgi:hypothetical protein
MIRKNPGKKTITAARRWAAVAALLCGAAAQPPARAIDPGSDAPASTLTARAVNSGFPLSHTTYNGLTAASDGKIYYVLCSESVDIGAQMFSYDPANGQVRHLGDLTEASGEKGLKAVPQGKSHTVFTESGGKLYFATHVDYYARVGGTELLRTPPPGYLPYQGGHFLSYDLATGKYENIAKAPAGQGILAMSMDKQRGRLYALTWPSGYFLRYDMATHEMKNLGKTSRDGEGGQGQDFRVLCRSLVLDPRDGSVYFTTFEGKIYRYRPGPDAIELVQGDDLKKDYFGSYSPGTRGTMGYNWRQTLWYPKENVFYGVHGNSGYLFRFDPDRPRVDVVQRITSLPSQRSGMYDEFWYGYLGFTLGPDGHTLYYLTGGTIYKDGRRFSGHDATAIGARGVEDLHLVTFDLESGHYADHGAIYFADGTRPAYVNSICVGRDGSVYALGQLTEKGETRTDLIRIQAP